MPLKEAHCGVKTERKRNKRLGECECGHEWNVNVKQKKNRKLQFGTCGAATL
jgi:hypothetical protein